MRTMQGMLMAGLVVLAGGMAGCGTGSSSAQTPKHYQVVVRESLPSVPLPILVVWRGTLVVSAWRWTALTEQVGQTPTVSLLAKPSTANTAKGGAIGHPDPAARAPGVLRQEVSWVVGRSPRLPRQPVPLVDAVLSATRALGSEAAIRQSWQTPVTLGGQRIPATIRLRAEVARPQGVVRQAVWTLVITTQATAVKPKHGPGYTIPSLTWTQRGTLQARSSSQG